MVIFTEKGLGDLYQRESDILFYLFMLFSNIASEEAAAKWFLKGTPSFK